MDYTFTCERFDIRRTLFCGQAFRWKELDGRFCGIAGGRYAEISDNGDSTYTVHGIEKSDISYWRSYFDLDTDYDALIKQFSEDEHMRLACKENPGIRVLRQEPFETLISFIISQDRGYMFPTLEKLVGVTAEDLAPLRAGFRARYIVDAVEKLHSTEVSLDGIKAMDTTAAREELKKIKGVGDKVADCVLLFGYHKTDAFPRDVWIKRIEQKLYPDGLPECIKGNEGIAQQFLFDYARTHEI